ncbi:hypothetical protein GBA52_028744 [Prunus armeniaca]|nr:hypothetical protein GBA52_028744 [Prunus armeniaca]
MEWRKEGTRAVLLGAKAAGSGVGYGTKGPRTSRKEAQQQRALRDSTVFLHLTGWTVDRKTSSIRPASRRAACLSCVTTLQSEWLF